MNATSIHAHSVEEIEASVEEKISEGFQPTLAFVFTSIQLDLGAIQKLFGDRNIQIFGATTEAEIAGATISKQSASIMLFDLNPDYFKIFIEEFSSEGYSEASRSIARKTMNYFEYPAFLLSGSGIWDNPYIEQISDGFKDVCGQDVVLFGGMAGSDMTFTDSFVFTNDQISTSAIIVIAFDQSKVGVKGISTCGWKGTGTSKTVTRSEDNHVYEIEGEPPLQLIMRYAGISEKPDNLFDLATVLNHTLQTQLLRGQREPIMRVGIPNMENDNISFIGSMPEGTQIRFCLLPDLDTMDESVRAIEAFKESEAPEADAVIAFACAGRLVAFGPEIAREVEGMSQVWDAPLVGFYSQGEFANTSEGDVEVQNLINVCVALKEN